MLRISDCGKRVPFIFGIGLSLRTLSQFLYQYGHILRKGLHVHCFTTQLYVGSRGVPCGILRPKSDWSGEDEERKLEEIETSHTLGGYRRCRYYSPLRYIKKGGGKKIVRSVKKNPTGPVPVSVPIYR